MRIKLNTNNSKKLVIGVTILFCAVILIVGGTLAFFTQSASSQSTGNIVSSNDNNTYINYYEDKSMMFDNLIPIKSNDISKALYSNNICKDKNGYNVCSAYIFTLQSTYKEVQKINISMIPTANSFTNLKYMLFKINDLSSGDVEIITQYPLPLEKNNLNSNLLLENQTLFSDDMITYAIVFYVESTNYDQTEEDAGKTFGATIRIDSLTTGTYIIKSFGEDCWKSELVEGTTDEYKLTDFYGINTNGSVKEECSGFVDKDANGYYSINVPSTHRGNKVTTLGYKLFSAVTMNDSGDIVSYNNYSKIKNIIIQEGITTIEDAKNETGTNSGVKSSFYGVGSKLENDTYLNVKFPNSLLYIGGGAFQFSNIRELNIPVNVHTIGVMAFLKNDNLGSLNFELDENGNSSLRKIESNAFLYCNLTYPEGSPLFIPPTVEYIGYAIFYGNPNLKQIKFTGDTTEFDSEWNYGIPVITE